MTSQLEDISSTDLKKLVKKAMEQPGVADVMQVYAKYRDVVSAARPYLRSAKVSRSYVVTDSVSH